MNLDEYDFDKTAQAVFVMNPSMKNMGYDSWEEFREFMVSCAYLYMHNSNSFSTGGFCLTAYDGSDGERNVRASVSGSLAYSYIFPK